MHSLDEGGPNFSFVFDESGPVFLTVYEVDIDEAEGNGICVRDGDVFLCRHNRGGTFKC